MFISQRREPLFSFAGALEPVKAGHANDLVLRPFGLYESDLNVDFNQTPRPFLVTEILDCCTREVNSNRVEPDFFWSLTVGKRIECLLNLLPVRSEEQIPFTFVCPNKECGQELEIEISLREISAVQAEAYEAELLPVSFEQASFTLRRPTGSDQLGWLKSNFANQDEASRAMLGSVVLEFQGQPAVGGESIPGTLLPVIEQALDEFDPLVNFSQRVNCFSCGAENLLEIDLEEFSLSRLRQAQMRLLAAVHRLAAHYHWSEREIFSVPYWRRSRYLDLIDKAKNQ